jgi:fatty acid/phospholipid biosynthesis enzyme
MRIALDVMGGDKAPEALMEGAIEALDSFLRG